MRYTGLELFMEKLKQLINSNYNPLISNHPSILCQRPQFQLLYEEIGSLIQTSLFTDEHYQLQQVKDLKKRLKDAAEDAHDIVDLFVYNINLGSKASLNLEDVMKSIKSIKEEFMTLINDNMKMDSSPRNDCLKTQSATAAANSCTRNPLGMKKVLKAVVGFDHHAELIRDKLAEDRMQLDVVSIVGMGGVGKTTLAAKVFNDPFLMYHLHVRGWVTVSHTYEKRDLLIQILESIGNKLNSVGGTYYRLREMLHKSLMGKRYLIVIDDIWNLKAWDDLKLFFPNNHTQSRILITSRLKEVALYAKSNGCIHQLEFLTERESWELLSKKVFHGDECPNSLIEPGMQIARNCHGLPLSLVVVAGVLGKEAVSKESWEKIGQSVSSYIVSDQSGYIETLALSVDHLPGHLRQCFLYLGGFPEDFKFQVQRLIWLWMAEGFIQEDDGQRSLEKIAEDYVMELVERNLVVVADRNSNGDVKTIYVHDLLRELCLEIATKESFCLKIQQTVPLVSAYYKHRHIFIEHNIRFTNFPAIRSLLCVNYCLDTRSLISNWSQFGMLLMVLDLQNRELDYLPEEIALLVHLRYLSFSYDGDFPSSICLLWSLQTLIVRRGSSSIFNIFELPNTISNLVNLRHLRCGSVILFPRIEKPMNLQTISRVELGDGVESLEKCFPSIKKLTCLIQPDMEYDFESLTFLEELKLRTTVLFVREIFPRRELKFKKNHIGFPASLKALTLRNCHLPWSDMSIIQSLPNLEVLKLRSSAFVGPLWDAGEEQFQQLKVLKLSRLGIKQWEASSINFPCLKQLVLDNCNLFEEIPSDLGNIPTLELINIFACKDSVVESLDAIQEDQHAQGNFELKISVNGQYRNVSSFNVW